MIQSASILNLILEHDLLGDSTELHEDSDLFLHGLDSMALMQLLVQLEVTMGISLQPTDITRERFSTARALAAFLTEHEQAAASR
jgi:acyl carrier protein